ncbi:MAG: hypothetical protein GX620_12500 [Chloroflexi bacterium]|nr:hypothetical protein [Chloroflexota bacterium]
MANEYLGYYALLTTQDNKGFVGSILVINKEGKPEEFRVTYAVKPSSLQEILYGESLVPHVGIELCGKPLYGALEHRLAALLVYDARLLGLGDEIDCLTACVKGENDTPPLLAEGEQAHKVHSRDGVFQPIVVQYPRSYNLDRQRQTELVLQKYMDAFDLIEPFHRIGVAIKALQQQDQRFN